MKCNPPFTIVHANGGFRPSAEGLHTHPTGRLAIARSVLTPIYRGNEFDRSNPAHITVSLLPFTL